ncbi:MAG: peptidoglycan DD-metalloendopeptidase family protein [Patescibacteria group bacterium]
MKKITKISLLLVFISIFLGLTTNICFASSQKEIDSLQNKINSKQSVIDELDAKIKVYKNNIAKKNEEELALNNQISIINDSINQTETEIDKTTAEISKLDDQIKLVKNQIEKTESGINVKQDQISEYILNIYQLENKTNLEIFLSDSSLSDYFSRLEYTSQLQEKFQEIMSQLKQLKDQLKDQNDDLNDNKDEQETKKIILKSKQDSAKEEKSYKNELLEETQADEEKFQELVAQIQKEEQQSNSEIAALEKTMRTKIDEANRKKNNNSNTNTSNTDNSIINADGFDPQWPVTGRVITVYFRDPSYPFRAYFEHLAIDIDGEQGDPIYACDDGVVAIAKFDGTPAYSYIMLIHADGFATVYGHTSAVYVTPDQIVKKGDLIGLMGGMRGGIGSGAFTTGSHIHFAIKQNGIYVDPLNYLP